MPASSPPLLKKPPFIVIEGIDRVGKNTQAELLVKRLRSAGITTSLFTTPDYEGKTGMVIERFLKRNLQVVDELRDPRSREDEVVLNCLMVANRYEVSSRIQHALRERIGAVCVRWYPSSILYAIEDWRWAHAMVSDLPEPDLCILLDADMEVVAGRLDPSNRYEREVEHQAVLAEGYREFWQKRRAPGWPIVGSNVDRHVVGEGVWRAVCEAFPHIAELVG